MGTGSPGQEEEHSELCASFDLGAPPEKIKLVISQDLLLSQL